MERIIDLHYLDGFDPKLQRMLEANARLMKKQKEEMIKNTELKFGHRIIVKGGYHGRFVGMAPHDSNFRFLCFLDKIDGIIECDEFTLDPDSEEFLVGDKVLAENSQDDLSEYRYAGYVDYEDYQYAPHYVKNESGGLHRFKYCKYPPENLDGEIKEIDGKKYKLTLIENGE